MSVKQMQKVWENRELDGMKKLIMLSLADNANDEGFCYPSIDTTCLKTGLSKPTVIKHQKELEEKGYLISKKRNRKNTAKGGRRLTTIYIVFPADNLPFLDIEILEKFNIKKDKNAGQSKEGLLGGQSKEGLPPKGGQSKRALPKPSLKLFNHHLYINLSNREKDLFLEYLAIRKKKRLVTTESIHNRLLKKYFELGRDENIILNAINGNWSDFYPPKQQNNFKTQAEKNDEFLKKAFAKEEKQARRQNKSIEDAEVISIEHNKDIPF